jgi:hypothetical protein
VLNVSAIRLKRVWPEVIGLRVEIVDRAGTALAGQRGQWRGRLRQVAFGGAKNAIVIDRGNIGADSGGRRMKRLGQKEPRRKKKRSGLAAKYPAGCRHGGSLPLAERVSRRNEWKRLQ